MMSRSINYAAYPLDKLERKFGHSVRHIQNHCRLQAQQTLTPEELCDVLMKADEILLHARKNLQASREEHGPVVADFIFNNAHLLDSAR